MLLLDACDNVSLLSIIYYAKEILKYVFILIPTVLILMVTIDIARNVISKDDSSVKSNLKLAVKRIIYAVVIFLIPSIVSFAMNVLVGSNVKYDKCLHVDLDTIKSQITTNMNECNRMIASGKAIEWDSASNECLLKSKDSNKNITVFDGSKLIASNTSESSDLSGYSDIDVIANGKYTMSYTFGGDTYTATYTSIGFKRVLSSVGKQPPGGCLTYSSKYSKKIFETSSVSGSGSYKILRSTNKQDILNIIANEVLNGRPCITRVNGKKRSGGMYTRHFVAVVGVKSSANKKSLKESDFLILDPTAALIKELNVTSQKRFLLAGEKDAYHREAPKGYVALVYSNKKTLNSYLSNKSVSKSRLS